MHIGAPHTMRIVRIRGRAVFYVTHPLAGGPFHLADAVEYQAKRGIALVRDAIFNQLDIGHHTPHQISCPVLADSSRYGLQMKSTIVAFAAYDEGSDFQPDITHHFG